MEHSDLINEYAELVSKLRNDQFSPVSVRYGAKYAKVVTGTAAHSFIDLTTMNVYKPAGWQAPAKGSRGNLLNWKQSGDPRHAGLDKDGFVFYKNR